MARYKTLVRFSGQNVGSDSVVIYHNDTELSLRFFYNASPVPKFFGYSPAELALELSDRIDELDATCSFTLLADLEATFRIDYLKRCYNKRKEPISRKFRKIYATKGTSASLEADLLESWKQYYPQYKNIVGAINAAFNYRDWLAHGRYWTPSLGRKYDFSTIFQISKEVRENLPLIY